MEIIKYSPTHLNQCIEIFRSNLDKYFDDSELQEYSDFLKSDALEKPYFVVKSNGTIIGAGGYFIYEGVYWLDWGMVDRNSHRKGIGTQLLNYRINKILEECETADIRLCTSQHTAGFYEKFGFVTLGITENGFGPGLHKYEMQRLASPMR